MARPDMEAMSSVIPRTPLAPPLASAEAPAVGTRQEASRWSALARVWHLARPLVLMVPVAQVAALLWVIWTRTPTALWWDEWETVTLVQHANQGTLTFNDFWALHWSTHRILVPRLIDLALIELTHWNRQVLMTFDLVMAIASALLLFSCVRLTLRSAKVRSSNTLWALVVPMSLLLFSFAQYWDWFIPFQLAFIATVFGMTLCLRAFLLEPVGWRKFGLAVLGALFATLSSAAGLTVWVAFLPSVARSGYRRLALWVGIAAAIIAAYLHGFPHVFAQPPLLLVPPYMAAYIGAPIAYPDPWRAALVGLFGLVLLAVNIYTYWRLRRDLRPILGWIELVLFVLGTAALTAEGRGTFHFPTGAINSRYQLFPALFWVAELVITTLVLRELASWLRHKRGAPGARLMETPGGVRGVLASWGLLGANIAAVIVLIAGCLVASDAGMSKGLAWQDSLVQHQQCITQYESASDTCLAQWFSLTIKQLNLSRAAYLKQHHLANFYTDQP